MSGSSNSPSSENSTDLVQSLVRGLAVIRSFDEMNPEQTLSDVARRTGLDRAAARRLLLTLVSVGYVRLDGRNFRLSPRVLELGQSYMSSLSLPSIAQPHLDALVAKAGESASLGVLDGAETVTVARATQRRDVLILTNMVGTRFPAYAGAMGRVLLANQPQEWLDQYLATANFEKRTSRTEVDPDRLRALLVKTREQEYSFINEELGEGLRSCAVPIKTPAGKVVAAINLSVHYSRISAESVRRMLLPPLQEARRDIEADLKAVAGGPSDLDRR
jgi:IclR family pca regulon transcriptional regulator